MSETTTERQDLLIKEYEDIIAKLKHEKVIIMMNNEEDPRLNLVNERISDITCDCVNIQRMYYSNVKFCFDNEYYCYYQWQSLQRTYAVIDPYTIDFPDSLCKELNMSCDEVEKLFKRKLDFIEETYNIEYS
jgi:hypothetical protein